MNDTHTIINLWQRTKKKPNRKNLKNGQKQSTPNSCGSKTNWVSEWLAKSDV